VNLLIEFFVPKHPNGGNDIVTLPLDSLIRVFAYNLINQTSPLS